MQGSFLKMHHFYSLLIIFVRGRFSTVYCCRRKGDTEAKSCDNTSDLVVKVISKSLMDSERAAYEANVMRSVDHCAFLSLLGAFTTDDAWMLVMPR